jgi:hypothetical protein
MSFRLGRRYVHIETGQTLYIVGVVNTDTYGVCLVGETQEGELKPVGLLEENAIGWVEAEGGDK